MVGKNTGVRPVAHRLRSKDSQPTVNHMVVACEECGDRFEFAQETDEAAVALAKRQVKWLTDQFTWDHIQETRHKGAITMPAL